MQKYLIKLIHHRYFSNHRRWYNKTNKKKDPVRFDEDYTVTVDTGIKSHPRYTELIKVPNIEEAKKILEETAEALNDEWGFIEYPKDHPQWGACSINIYGMNYWTQAYYHLHEWKDKPYWTRVGHPWSLRIREYEGDLNHYISWLRFRDDIQTFEKEGEPIGQSIAILNIERHLKKRGKKI